ncbi:MAG: hypothetical protein HPY66_2885 [Firmicutes bacterium]|nr:hypothetical protein [Bacillota bacterium]
MVSMDIRLFIICNCQTWDYICTAFECQNPPALIYGDLSIPSYYRT